jgi:sugar phosphate isomerase/epimerase
MSPYTRREFAKLALTAIPAAGLLSSLSSLRAADAAKPAGKPNSKVRGVMIGLNVPYSFGNNLMPADEVLANCVELGVSGLELRTQPVELFMDKHKLMIGYHGHTHTGPKDWEEAFSLAKYNGANVDIGHYVAGLNESPVPFIKERHDRITHVHIKDKKMHEGPAIPFGTGDTPIAEVLQLLRDNKWPIQATIEFEYKVPAGSTRMAEIAKCVQYCRDALA